MFGRIHTRFISATMLAVALALLLNGSLAFAARSLCRSDPVITLSNGVVLTMWADSETDLSNIESIDYYLRVPPGLSVVDVVHPDPTTADRENFYFSDDQPPNQYGASIVVHLVGGPSAKVHGYASIAFQKVTLLTLKKDGDSGRELRFSLRTP